VHSNDYDDFGSEIEMLEQGLKLVVKLVYKEGPHVLCLHSNFFQEFVCLGLH